MSLAIFDIDGTLTESVAVDEVCFVQAFQDVLGIGSINTNWLDYHFQTDSGLTLEICRNHLGREPGRAEIRRLQDRFAQLLCAAVEEAGQPIREIPGAAALLHALGAHRRWPREGRSGEHDQPHQLPLRPLGKGTRSGRPTMSPITMACVIFACVFGAALLAMLLGRALPEHHLRPESKEAVKLG
jgi:beta-phosphoglucomutase-like phosphatase (HAD superfamily)